MGDKFLNKKIAFLVFFSAIIFFVLGSNDVFAQGTPNLCCYNASEYAKTNKPVLCRDFFSFCPNEDYRGGDRWSEVWGGQKLTCQELIQSGNKNYSIFCGAYLNEGSNDPTDKYQATPPVVPILSIPIPGLNLTSDKNLLRVCAECSEAVAEGQTCPDDKCVKWTYKIPWIGEYIFAFYKWAVSAIAILAVLVIVNAGFGLVMAAGNQTKITAARDNIFAGIIGLMLILVMHQFLAMIDPRLVILKPIVIGSIKREEINIVSQENIASEAELIVGQGTNNVPLFKQWDSQWNNHPFGVCGTIGASGCGPTSLAMVLKNYGQNVNPASVADKVVASGFRVCSDNPGVPPTCSGCSGTAHAAFWGDKSIPKQIYNFKTAEYLGNKSAKTKILQYLQQGKPIIAAMGPSIFTKHGHFIVLTGIDSSGNVLINDPNKNISRATQDEVFCCLTAAFYIAP